MSDVHLNRAIVSGLTHLGGVRYISDSAFPKFVSLTFSIILSKEPPSALKAFSEVDPLVIKQVFAAVVSLVFEASRLDTDPIMFRGLLTECNITESRADTITSAYERNRASLRDMLQNTSFEFPHVTDVDWRLDYYLKSHTLEKIDQPTYHIALKTENPDGGDGEVEFTCSLQEMQDLVYKLRDATNHTRMIAEL